MARRRSWRRSCCARRSRCSAARRWPTCCCYGPAAGEAARLADLRLAALEQRVDLDLALIRGHHSALVTELEALTAEHPYRERFHAQLMLALYRAGRQADALDAYRRARQALVDDLGLEPSPTLKRLEAAILAHDPDLEIPAPAAPPPRPPPRSALRLAAPAPRCQLPPAPLLGRADDLATATALLADPTVRLLTLTGPGGIGKTRFSLELAHQLAPEFPDGARFVALAALDDPARVGAELAQAIGDDPLAALLVIDNFEQILAAANEVGALLAAHPDAKVVVTSRAPLRLAAEHELALGPLDAAPAAALFLRRARAVDPRLALEGGDEQRIEQICARLDGLPLAIELAAAGSKILSPASILERLGHRLDLLNTGPRDVPARQQTLRGAIGWSYDLLDEPGRRLFCELAVFSGGFTVEAAEAVCGPEAFDGIVRLVDQSLLTRDGRRFGMLETVREYALERLAESGELDATRDRHARAFAALTVDAESGLHSADVRALAAASRRRPRQPARRAAARDRDRRRRHRARAGRRLVALVGHARRGRRGRGAGGGRARHGRGSRPRSACARSTAPASWPPSRATSRRRACASRRASGSPASSATTSGWPARAPTSPTSRRTRATTRRRSGCTRGRSRSPSASATSARRA